MCLTKATIAGRTEPKGEFIPLPTVEEGYTEAEIEVIRQKREARIAAGVEKVGDDPKFFKR